MRLRNVSLRLVLASFATSALVGCSMAPRGYEAYDANASAVGDRQPMAALPAAAGAVVAVLQSDVREVLTQRIVLKGDPDTLGENAIVVMVNHSRGPSDVGGPTGIPTKAMIADELNEAFAGVEMQLSESFARNSFGPFGYAIGHPNARTTCLYAWEWGLTKPATFAEPNVPPSMPAHPTSVRVRLCRSTMSETDMVALLEQMQVYPPGSSLAYSDPAYSAAPVQGDALAAAGVAYFVVPGASAAPRREPIEPAAKPHPHKTARNHEHRHRERLADVETRASAPDRRPDDSVAVPMPGAGAPAATSANPLLAPLASAVRAPADDMPLPGRLTQAQTAAAPAKAASVPLPQ